MATLEKPRHKKKNKSRTDSTKNSTNLSRTLEDVAFDPEEVPSAPSLNFLDLDTDYTSIVEKALTEEKEETKHEEVLSGDCSVSSEIQVHNDKETDNNIIINKDKNVVHSGSSSEDNAIAEESITSETMKSLKEELEEEKEKELSNQASNLNINQNEMHNEAKEDHIEPTAPDFDDVSEEQHIKNEQLTSPFTYEPRKVVQYPSLSKMRSEENKINVYSLLKKDRMKAFTSSQLKEIYDCSDLEEIKLFELEFLTEWLQDNFQEDPLQIKLEEYFNLRSKIKVNLLDLKKIWDSTSDKLPNLWDMEERTLNFIGVCGDGISVQTTETFNVAVLNTANLESMGVTLSQIHEIICVSYTTNLIHAKIIRLQIEQIIKEILTYPAFENVYKSGNKMNLKTALDVETSNCKYHLRRAISILFGFIRKPCPDKEFADDLKKWLTKLTGLYLRIATKLDYWFLLFHLMRCPSGVGKWAANFLQIPEPKTKLDRIYKSVELNNCLAVLHVLLTPIKNRNDFLRAFSQSHQEISDPIKDEIWILVDSDGEEGNNSNGECIGLKENDLINLLNQIPLEAMHRYVLGIEKKDGKYHIHSDIISGNKLLEVIAFNSILVNILGEGLITYNTERYKQFAKRLGRLIGHSIKYVANFRELYTKNNLFKDTDLCDRLSIEFNSFIIKACSYVYRARNLGTWQYFSALPFSVMESRTIWQLFYYLSVGFPIEYPSPTVENFSQYFYTNDFWNKFNASIDGISQEDIYYVLQAFFEMAISCERMKDWDLISLICSHIFVIGFLNESTKETCYKTCRDMLFNICSTYPDLISSILIQIRARFNDIENGLYLFKLIPLNIWKPELDSFEILANWLLNYGYESPENVMARLIIGHLNWGFDTDEKLFLPHNIHVRMACLIIEASGKHSPELVGLSGISENVRQVSGLSDNQTLREQFTNWCWNMMSTLRLHLLDQGNERTRRALETPWLEVSLVPSIENLDAIYQGVSKNRPLAIYGSMLISTWGHSVPLICQKGFPQLKLLISDYRHAAVLRCLELIIPLFLECPDTLKMAEDFHEILKSLLSADRTYMKMAKDLITPSSPGPVLTLFKDMLQAQITNYVEFGFQSPKFLINLWIQILTCIPGWQNTSVPFLIDTILSIAYQFSDSWEDAKRYIAELFAGSEEWKVSKGSALKMFLGTTSSMEKPPVATSENPWFGLLLLEIEFETQERRKKIWSELLRMLAQSDNDKMGVDTALKKTIALLKCASFPSTTLVIYKYANIISSLECSHPLFPIFCQKFFNLYLHRVPFSEDEERFLHVYGVADKFYEHNIPLMKRVKNALKLAEVYYGQAAAKRSDDEALNHFYLNCAKITKAYLLWLEETSINRMCLNQHIDLPPEYNVDKLRSIFSGNEHYWLEFVHFATIRKNQQDGVDKWLKSCHRFSPQTPIPSSNSCGEIRSSKPPLSPADHIIAQLNSYDEISSPPDLKREQLILKPLSPQDIDSKKLVEIKDNFKLVKEYAKKFNCTIKELNAVNCSFKDLVLGLYKNVPYKEKRFVKCSSILSSLTRSSCKLAAKIEVKLEKPHKIDSVESKIKSNREKHDEIVNRLIKQNVDGLVLSSQTIEHLVKYLVTFKRESLDSKFDATHITDVAIEFFFHIVNNMDDNVITFAASRDISHSLLSELGDFIQSNQETQGIKILDTALKRPDLLMVLAELFIPARTKPEYFLNMYKFLVDSHMRNCDPKILFVLLSKFDLQNWLIEMKPKLAEINRLLKMILHSLENWNKPESNLLQDLFRRHLIHIFEYEFPEHYGEVLQCVLKSISEQKLVPAILLDLLNSILLRSGCAILTLESNRTETCERIIEFAMQQRIFTFKEIRETILLFTRHFQSERLQHGLHGLYPKHKDYCLPLSIWFAAFGHSLVISAIYSHSYALADQICDLVFEPISELYAPWLIVYTGNHLQQYAANWIKQLISDGKVLYPWSDIYTKFAEIMLFSFFRCLQYTLESLPVACSTLGHSYSWYLNHFTSKEVNSHMRLTVHKFLIRLPWERFRPSPEHISGTLKVLKEFIPECHSFVGIIITRVNWNKWILETFPTFNNSKQSWIIQMFFTMLVQISFEPNVHDNPSMAPILKDALTYPWELIEYQGLESVLEWFVVSVEPSVILKIPLESNEIDQNVLELLKVASGMDATSTTKSSVSMSQIRSKRILYVRSVVRMLRACGGKHSKLLCNKNGYEMFRNATVELLDTIREVSTIGNTVDRKDCEQEAQNMIIEMICSIPTQSEFTAKLTVDSIIFWQTKSDNAAGDTNQLQENSPLLSTILSAIGLCKLMSNSMYSLLEVTICNYFHSIDKTNIESTPYWALVLQKLGQILDLLEIGKLIQEPYLLVMHVYIIHRFRKITNVEERISFLQDVIQLLEGVKTNESTESRMAIVWGALIGNGCKMLENSENAKKPLLMLGRYLHVTSTQAEGWGEGILGAIGLKRDSVTNRRKILTRCFSCVIFSLFPDLSQSENKTSQEFLLSFEDLKSIINIKKYADIKSIALKAISIIEENLFPKPEEAIENVYKIIRLLYANNFLTDIPEFWST